MYLNVKKLVQKRVGQLQKRQLSLKHHNTKKEKQMKKLILVLVILMAAGYLYAGGQSEASETVLEINKTGLPIVEEKVTIDVVSLARVHHGDFSQMTFLKEMEENTNIHLEVEAVPQGSYPEKKNLKLASGDLPDVFAGLAVITASDIVKYGSEGIFLPLEDLIEEWAPNLSALKKKYPDLFMTSTAPDGHIYALPRVEQRGVNAVMGNFFINKKWLDNLGLEVPDTFEEYFTVLKAFKEQDANGNGDPNDEIPYEFAQIGMQGNRSLAGFGNLLGAYGQATDTLILVDGSCVYAPVTEKYKKSMIYLKKFFDAGLFDPEGFTYNIPTHWSKFRGSDPAVIGSFISWNDHDVVGNAQDEYLTLPPLAGPEGDRAWMYGPHFAWAAPFAVLTSANQQPELTIRYFDEYYKIENSIKQFWGDAVTPNGDGTFSLTPVPEGRTYDELKYRNTPSDYPGAVFADDFGKLVPRSVSVAEKYNDIQTIYMNYPQTTLFPTNILLTPEDNEIITTYFTDIENFTVQKQAEWLLGKSDLESDWDSYIKRMNDMGLQKILDVYTAAWQKLQ